MGAVSYLEDIIERWDFFSERDEWTLPAGHFKPAPPKESGWIRLVHPDGVPFADRFVPLVGEPIRAGVAREKAHVPWVPELEPSENQPLPVHAEDISELTMTFSEPGLYVLHLICGAYSKRYEIEVVAQPEIDTLPEFKDTYDQLVDTREKWTENNIHRLLEALRQPNGGRPVSQSFADGLFEYHLALYLADLNPNRSRECFAEAYRKLRPFAGLTAC